MKLSSLFPQLSLDRDPFMRAFSGFPARKWPSRSTHWAPTCDLYDNGKMYVLNAEIPGAQLVNLRLCVKSGRLILDAWGKGFNLAVDKPCYTRTFYIDPVDVHHCFAEFGDGGRLYATLPKLPLGADKKCTEGRISITEKARELPATRQKHQSVSLGSLLMCTIHE